MKAYSRVECLLLSELLLHSFKIKYVLIIVMEVLIVKKIKKDVQNILKLEFLGIGGLDFLFFKF